MVSRVNDLFKRLVKRLLLPAVQTSPASQPQRRQEWSIGIYTGVSPFRLGSPENIANPVLTRRDVADVSATFVADPFMIHANHHWYMFFEVMNREMGKGEIGLATSPDSIQWTYQHIVLKEPYHLSYPYIFKWDSEYYMIPESYQADAIRLYKAIDFPIRWSFVKELLTGYDFVDPSVFRFHDKWWLFTGLGAPPLRADTLRLYYAEDLAGQWIEHPQSPIVEGNSHIARPAGRALVLEDRVIRYTQDCHATYGAEVRAFEITELTTTRYHEQLIEDINPVLSASTFGWNASGMHHIDPHLLDDGRWIACVDGFLWEEARGSPKENHIARQNAG